MPLTRNDIEQILNRITSVLPLVDKTDLTSLTAILSDLETVNTIAGVPPAFKTLATRTLALVEHIILQETDFDGGLKKLGEGVSKMCKAIKELNAQNAPGKNETSAPKTEAGNQKIVDGSRKSSLSNGPALEENGSPISDLQDLLVKFASSQQNTLEDFEAYILELEKQNPEAKNAINRILHTWKGEFGVLSLQEYSRLIHEVETELENDALTADQLFRLKDFLQERFLKFTSKMTPNLTEADREFIFGTMPASAVAEPEKTIETSVPQPKEKLKESAPALENIFSADPSMVRDFIVEARDLLKRV
jgi:HPt (histidine-containing phosphotransfer) domain-containing protein